MNLHDLYEKSNHAAFCFGRLNPPTLGHKQLLDTVARAGQGNYYIFLSQTQKLPDNPLSYEEKVKFVRAMFPEHSKHVITGPGLNTIMRVASWVYNQGVRSVSFVAGSDRLEDFKALLDKYNGYGEPGQEGYYNFDSIQYVSSGERDPDAEGVVGYSASKARAAVAANDFNTFKEVTGAGKLAQQLYDAVKAALEAAPVKKPSTKKTKVAKEGVTEEFTDDLGNIYALHPDPDEGESIALEITDVDDDEFSDRWARLPLDYINEFGGDLPLWDMEDLKLYPNIKVQPVTFDQYVKLVGNYIRSEDLAGSALTKMKQDVPEDLNEMDKSAPQPGRDGRVSHRTYGSRDTTGERGSQHKVKPQKAKDAAKDAEQILNKIKIKEQGVAEGISKTDKDTESGSNIKDLFAKFLPLAAEYLGLDKLPKINIEMTLPDHNGQASFGGYNSNTKEINLAIANRHPVDIFRTLAHELVHYKQDLLGKIKDYSGETGSTEENQANTVAGIIMRLFNKAHPDAMNAKVVTAPEKNLDEDVVDDTVQYNDTLEPLVWDGNKLKPEVRNRLLIIAQKFIDSLNIEDFDAKDIVLTGSMANYNYTKFSDFDLHVITDYDALECAKLAEEFYQSKKRIWNRDYDIQINGHDVELYVEDDDDPPISGGVYSILDDRWIKEPSYDNPDLDVRAVRAKTREYIRKIQDALNGHLDAEGTRALVKKLRDMRTAGLEQAGEFSVENLAYKTLRNAGILDKLSELQKHQINTDLSL